jgi:hypothetical protein
MVSTVIDFVIGAMIRLGFPVDILNDSDRTMVW